MGAEIDTTEFEEMMENFNLDPNKEIPKMFDQFAKEIAGRYLARVIKRTPVEENQNIKYHVRGGGIATEYIKGGALRHGWTNNMSEVSYLNSLNVEHKGLMHEFTISNNVDYATYVEYGHRQNVGQFVPVLGETVGGVRTGATLKRAWVSGQFMMTNTNAEMEHMLPELADKLLVDYLEKLVSNDSKNN